jgi:hypothetical protein
VLTGQPAYDAGLVLNHEDIHEVYLGKEETHNSQHFEIERWRTWDNGGTWAKTADITAGSPNLPDKVFRPYVPINHHPDLPVLFIGGTYTAYDNFDTYMYRTYPSLLSPVYAQVAEDVAQPIALKLLRTAQKQGVDISQVRIMTKSGVAYFPLVEPTSPLASRLRVMINSVKSLALNFEYFEASGELLVVNGEALLIGAD